jgi:DNA-binding MarR family transcriptional regulator
VQPTSRTQSILEAPPGSDDALARDLGLLVRHLLARSNRRVFSVFDDLDLSFSQAKIVMSFTGNGARSVKALADEHGLSLPAASRAIDGLLKRGLVTRTEHPDDRRVKQIALTDAGREITEHMFELRVAGIQDFVASIDPADRKRLAAALVPVVPADHADALFPIPAPKDPANA